LAVNVIYPEKPRYVDGAPVAVIVPAGDSANGLTFSAHSAQQGFAEVRFAFPGGGVPGLMSGGIYDYRGVSSQEALRDVILFADGKLADVHGRRISDLVPCKLSQKNVGLIGWSNGGNAAIITLARYAQQLQCVSWLTFYESPVGSMLFPPNLGGERDLTINPHYRLGSCATGDCLVDYRKLSYQREGNRDEDKHKKLGEPILPGIVYFDENRNGRWDEANEFAFSYALDVGLDKQIYPPDVTAAMQRMNVFLTFKEDYGPMGKKHDKEGKVIRDPADDFLLPKQIAKREKARNIAHQHWMDQIAQELKEHPNPKVKVADGKVLREEVVWPDNVATLAESEAYFKERDGSLYIDQLCSQYPDLLITVFGSVVDHMQRQLDHPHIALLYNAFLSNRAHWLRLNPDPIYVGFEATMNGGNFSNNKPNSPIDASDMKSQLEPEGLIPDYLYMNAAIAELADRTHAHDLSDSLTAVLTEFKYGGGPLPKQEQAE
jgi:hypothetical protein